MSECEYRADMLYHVALSVAKSMLCKRLITEAEYTEIRESLLRKYHPYLGELLSENDLI